MKENVFEIELEDEVINYLERLSLETNSKEAIIARIIEMHSADNNVSVLDSAVFKHYEKEHQRSLYEYELAKSELQKRLQEEVIKRTNDSNVSFNWVIENFANKKAKVTIL